MRVPHSVVARQPDPMRTNESASHQSFPRFDAALFGSITLRFRRCRRRRRKARFRDSRLPGSVTPLRRCRRWFCPCAPDWVLMMEPDFVSSSYLSLWRFTLRRLLLVSCRVVSPRPLPSRDFTGSTSCVSARCRADGPPHGFAQPPSSLLNAALPRHFARSFLGFAYKQAL